MSLQRGLGQFVKLAAAAVTIAIAVATVPAPRTGAPAAAGTRAPGTPRSPIKHIVFVVKENRSFDHYFGAMPDPGHDLEQSTRASCYDKADPTVVDRFTMPAAPDPMPQDVAHANYTFYQAYHRGAMDGFCHEKGAIVNATGARHRRHADAEGPDPQLLGLRDGSTGSVTRCTRRGAGRASRTTSSPSRPRPVGTARSSAGARSTATRRTRSGVCTRGDARTARTPP